MKAKILSKNKNSISFELSGSPIPYARHRTTFKGGKSWTYNPKSLEKKCVQGLLRDLIGGIKKYPYDTNIPIELVIIAFFKIPKSRKNLLIGTPHIERPDGDNILKFYSDCMINIFYKDDAQVCRSEMIKCWAETPCVIITVRNIGDV